MRLLRRNAQHPTPNPQPPTKREEHRSPLKVQPQDAFRYGPLRPGVKLDGQIAPSARRRRWRCTNVPAASGNAAIGVSCTFNLTRNAFCVRLGDCYTQRISSTSKRLAPASLRMLDSVLPSFRRRPALFSEDSAACQQRRRRLPVTSTMRAR